MDAVFDPAAGGAGYDKLSTRARIGNDRVGRVFVPVDEQVVGASRQADAVGDAVVYVGGDAPGVYECRAAVTLLPVGPAGSRGQ